MKLNVNPSFAGTGQKIDVDGSMFSLPADAEVRHVEKANGLHLAWVLHDKQLYLFSRQGQITGIDDATRGQVLAKYFTEAEKP